MNAGGTCLLCKTSDQLFNLFAGYHHEISQLIDHHNDLWQRYKCWRLGIFWVGKWVANWATFFNGVFDFLIKAREVSGIELTHGAVASLHFTNTPVQGIRCKLHIGDDRRQKMGNALID